MGVAPPPPPITTSTIVAVACRARPTTTPITSRTTAANGEEDDTSMSQGFHQGGGIFSNFSSAADAFDRGDVAGDDGTPEHGHQQPHVAQQSRRDKLRVPGFDPATGHALLQEGREATESGIYDPGAAGAAANMLSEMFNFPAAGAPSASELLASQMSAAAGYHLGLRSTPTVAAVPGLSVDNWYGPGRHGTMIDPLGEASPSKQHAGMTATAMHLFLMNPQQQQQQQSRSSASPPPNAHAAFQRHQQALQVLGGGGGPAAGVEGLSLSLSSSLQPLEMVKAEELRMQDGMLYFGNQTPTHQLPPPTAAAAGPMQGHIGAMNQQLLHVGYGPTPVAGVLRNSRYARPAQELLEEFCSVSRGQFKGAGTGGGGSSSSAAVAGRLAGRHKNAASTSSSAPKNAGSAGAAAGPSTSAAAAASSSSASKEAAVVAASTAAALSPADRFEHQRRKAKLISMLDEVDRRYNHYCDQMQMVVNYFDSVMGFGSATPYTALAQKAMSRHFRCLKDAIADQLRATCEALGEKDVGGSSGITKGETPRLRLLDQSLRQQRAFHHMGIMEQEAWRPQRGLPERSVNILRAWLFEHFLHPYPSDADKHLLARQTGLSRNQVSNWFINARVRLWKPMIEEMYQMEGKDHEDVGGAADASDHDAARAALQSSATAQPQHHLILQQRQHQQSHNVTGISSGPLKLDPSTSMSGPSGSGIAVGGHHLHHSDHDQILIGGIDPVELLGGADAHLGPTDDIYGRYSVTSAAATTTMRPIDRMRYNAAAAAAAASTTSTTGDVSLTLGLQHAGGNTSEGGAGGGGRGRFSLRDYNGI